MTERNSQSLSEIGFIGIGIMGNGMLRNLITKFPNSTFHIWNRSRAACEQIKSSYPDRQIHVENEAGGVVANSNVTFSMLSNLEASQSVIDGDGGVVGSLMPEKIFVDCSTLTVDRMLEIQTSAQSKGAKFLEAPVSGSKGPAELGQLIFLCGGPKEVFDEVSPALDAMGKAKFHFGEVGSGTKVKLIINMMMTSMLAILGEGLSLSEAVGIDISKLLEVVDLSGIANGMFKGKGNMILNENYTPNFPLKHAQKDIQFALDLAAEHSVQLPTTSQANEHYKQALQENLGDEDFAAVYKAIRKDHV